MFELITVIILIISIYIILRAVIRQVSGKGCSGKKSCSDCSGGCIGNNNL